MNSPHAHDSMFVGFSWVEHQDEPLTNIGSFIFIWDHSESTDMQHKPFESMTQPLYIWTYLEEYDQQWRRLEFLSTSKGQGVAIWVAAQFWMIFLRWTQAISRINIANICKKTYSLGVRMRFWSWFATQLFFHVCNYEYLQKSTNENRNYIFGGFLKLKSIWQRCIKH